MTKRSFANAEHSNAEFGMRNAELEGDTFARPNKFRNRKKLRAIPFRVKVVKP